MSDTTAHIAAQPTPGVPESGPASGTTPEAAAPAAAPADFSPEVTTPVEVDAPAPAVEVAAPVESILSEAKPAEEVKAEEPKAPEAKAEEVKTEEPKAEEKPVERPAPVYEAFKLPEDVKFEDAKLSGFTGLLGEFENAVSADPTKAHAAAQEFGQKLLDMYVEDGKAQAAASAEANAANWARVQEDWAKQFRDDPEIGKNRADTSLTRMGGLMDMYGQKAGTDRLTALRGVLTMTGAGNNLEVLRFVNWAASQLVERSRPVAAPQARPPAVGSKATRLYKSSNGAA